MKRPHLGIAVVGSGRIGTLRARLAAKHPSVRFLAVSDKDPARAKALARSVGRPITDGMIDHVVEQLADAWETEEAKEGVTAFFEKRRPNWQQA